MLISDGSVPTKYIKKGSSYLKQDTKLGTSFLTSSGCFIGADITADLKSAPYSSEPPRTINYYTPKFDLTNSSKIQIGVSYTPDTANTGIGGVSEKSDGMQTKTLGIDGVVDKYEIDRSVKNIITAGVLLEQKCSDDIRVKLAITGEQGKAVGKLKKFTTKDDKTPEEFKLANLRSYNIGSELQIRDLTLGACYGSLAKSFTNPEIHKSGCDSYYYSIAASYKYDNTTTKVTYFASERYKNKVSAFKLNVSHLLAKGLKPYAELSSYTLKGKPEFYNKLNARTTKGLVGLVGVKLTL